MIIHLLKKMDLNVKVNAMSKANITQNPVKCRSRVEICATSTEIFLRRNFMLGFMMVGIIL